MHVILLCCWHITLTYCFPLILFDITSCIFKAKDFNCFSSVVPDPFYILSWFIKLSLKWDTVSHMEIVKRLTNQKIFFLDKMTIHMTMTIQNDSLRYPFIFCYLITTFMFFVHSVGQSEPRRNLLEKNSKTDWNES